MTDAAKRAPEAGPRRPASLPREEAARLAKGLEAWLVHELGGPHLPNPEGYRITAVEARFYMMRHVPVAMLARGASTLGFIVTPQDLSERAYRRTPRFDVTYFTEDVRDHEQDLVYAQNRAMIDRFAAWVARWDAGGGDDV